MYQLRVCTAGALFDKSNCGHLRKLDIELMRSDKIFVNAIVRGYNDPLGHNERFLYFFHTILVNQVIKIYPFQRVSYTFLLYILNQGNSRNKKY